MPLFKLVISEDFECLLTENFWRGKKGKEHVWSSRPMLITVSNEQHMLFHSFKLQAIQKKRPILILENTWSFHYL